MRPALFLDRDGTINVDPGYLKEPERVELFTGVVDALTAFKKAGYWIFVISNQSGVGRGWITPDQLKQVQDRINLLLGPKAAIDKYWNCLSKPEENDPCRKPGAGYVVEVLKEFSVDIDRSIFVGDKFSDIECGIRGGIPRRILVRTGWGKDNEAKVKARFPETEVIDSLALLRVPVDLT